MICGRSRRFTSLPVLTTSFTAPVLTRRGAIGLSIARRYVVSSASGAAFSASASRARLAWRFVSTGNEVPRTFSKSRTGRLRASFSSFTISAVISYAGPTSREPNRNSRSEEHTSELQSHHDLVCRLLLEKKQQ